MFIYIYVYIHTTSYVFYGWFIKQWHTAYPVINYYYFYYQFQTLISDLLTLPTENNAHLQKN